MRLITPKQYNDEFRSNTWKHAKRELDILTKSSTDPENRPIIEEFIPEILELVDKFGNSGQSGGSYAYVASAIADAVKTLCKQETICSITGIDDEWIDMFLHMGEECYQNVREGSIFKEGKDGKSYYLDAIVKKTETSSWSGPFWLTKEDYLNNNIKNKITGRQYIKSFPFTPKTFYIDVIEEEVAPDDWEMWCKDPKQLNQVWEYYDKYE